MLKIIEDPLTPSTHYCSKIQLTFIRPSSSVHTETQKSLKDIDDCVMFSVPDNSDE
jgi:hypothetical protein